MNLTARTILASVLIVASTLYVIPWDKFGIDIPALSKPYTLGLDLQWGIELDYKVDFDNLSTASGSDIDKTTIVEGLKAIIDRRVNSLGLAEPTLQTANYGGDTHIIVQIPTKEYWDISDEEREEKSHEDIKAAKETIGKVVKLEFKEEKKEITEEDKLERRALAETAIRELDTTPFATVGQKYRDQYENVIYTSGTGALPSEASFSGVDAITIFPYRSGIESTQGNVSYTLDAEGNALLEGNPGYAIVDITAKEWTGYVYSYIFIDERPSLWTPAKTADGRILNDSYLVSAGSTFSQAGQPQVELLFNDEGKAIFAEITKRLLGKQLAIYVGGQPLTAPTIQSVIPDGRAVITGDYTITSAKELAQNITTGIVPAPIYLTSERTIDAKIGASALTEILVAGLIWLGIIVVFLTVFYRVSWLLAGVALVAYTIFLIALIKLFGPVLTLASIAGVILSIGLAIDANILIFERMREALREGNPLMKSIHIGFDKSWTAIWDSHVTSLVSAFILFFVGISMIKGFGLMLGLGIILSLFTSMWVSRVLIEVVGQYMKHNTKMFVGEGK